MYGQNLSVSGLKMGVKLTLDSDWWIYTMRENDASKTQFREDIKSMLLESGGILNKEVDAMLVVTELDKEAYQTLRDNLDCKITRDTAMEISAEAGWLFDKYDAKNPALGVKAIWLNYGTKDRATNAGHSRGSETPRAFLKKARNNAAKKIHALQVRRVNEALDRYGADKNRRPIID